LKNLGEFNDTGIENPSLRQEYTDIVPGVVAKVENILKGVEIGQPKV
jgi:hypothetical protein